jgi:acyl carrier protein
MGLDLVEMVMDVEQDFDIQIPDSDAAELRTLGALYYYVRTHAPRLTIKPEIRATDGVPRADPVWQRLVDIVERTTGQRGDRMTPNTRFVEDLRMG